jgi:hypothetical protein
MMEKPADVATLTKEMIIESLGAFNFPRGEFWQNTVGRLFYQPARRFSEVFAKFDQDVASFGISEAAKRLLTVFADTSNAVGQENIPKEGPLLIASNHPGTVDGVSIVANAARDDIKVVVGGMPFLQKLPVAKNFTIVAQRNANLSVRANTVRQSIRHLKNGGALLIFPSGEIDPDPAVLPGAREALDNWSRSIAIMLRQVPEAHFIPVITSGVLHEKFTKSPFTFLKKDGVGKRRIMEYMQVIRQLIFKERLGLRPFITFDKPFTLSEIGEGGLPDSQQILSAIIERARKTLENHTALLNDQLDLNRTMYA